MGENILLIGSQFYKSFVFCKSKLMTESISHLKPIKLCHLSPDGRDVENMTILSAV